MVKPKVTRDPQSGKFISVRVLKRRRFRRFFLESIMPKWLRRKQDGDTDKSR